MEFFDKTKQSVKETNKQVISQGLGMIGSAFVLVAALAWNEFIKNLIATYLHNSSGLISQFIYAVIVTVLAVIMATRLNKIASRYKDENK